MCELFGVTSQGRIVLNELLLEFFSHGVEHPNGWGMAFFYGNAVSLEKQPEASHKSVYLKQRLQFKVEADKMIAHIRLATRGNLNYENTHPFVMRDNSNRTWTLAHTTIHHVGAEPELYTVEYNSAKNDVNEQVIKGNIAIIKHTDNGETQIETPEEGAVFEVYLKSAGGFDAAEETERDTLICDENGFAQTKDMPYGIYTVHQTSGWDGRS